MDETISELRSFNRFYTQSIGALDASFLGTEMSLPEARLLYELAHADKPLAVELQTALGMDPAYISRVIARFEKRGWISRDRAAGDSRRRPIALTSEGRAAFSSLDDRQRSEVRAKIEGLVSSEQAELNDALRRIQRLLGARTEESFTLRAFRPGDMGMIASRQAVLYREANGWNEKLEVNVGESAFSFLKNFKPGREQCWVAELSDRLAGSIVLTDEEEGWCRLRLVYVEPFARRKGIGEALLATSIQFARAVGYCGITLWTHTELDSARRMYARHGFTMTETEVHDRFGPTIQSETWRLNLIS